MTSATLQSMDRCRALLTALAAAVAVLGLSLDAFAEAGAVVLPGRSVTTDDALAPDEWLWPLAPSPQVVAGFDPPTTPYGPGHVGVDLLGWPGQLVGSVAAGTVAFAGHVAGVPVVSVQHGSERSTYQPVVATLARGDTVVAGQFIGTLSNARSHCLPLTCLHLGRRRGETYLDPLELLGGGPVRLLPRHGEPLAYGSGEPLGDRHGEPLAYGSGEPHGDRHGESPGYGHPDAWTGSGPPVAPRAGGLTAFARLGAAGLGQGLRVGRGISNPVA